MRARPSRILVVLASSAVFAACGDPNLPSPQGGASSPPPTLGDRADSGTPTPPPVLPNPTPAVDSGATPPPSIDAGAVDAGSPAPAVDAGGPPTPNPNPTGCSATPQTPDPAWSRGCPAYSPSIRAAGWENFSTRLYTSTCDPNHRGRDKVVNPGEATQLIGKFAYCELIDKDLKEEWVQTWVQDAQCRFTMVSRQKTSVDNAAVTIDGVKDDGGRIFQLLAGTAATEGSHNVTMLVEGDLSRADFAFHVFKRGTKSVVFDIDATLTVADLEMVMSFAADVFGGRYSPSKYEGGAELTRLLAAKGYKIIYLTARPDFMRTLTEKWLRDGGYAAGVLYTTNLPFSLSPPSKEAQLAYKKERMADLVTRKGIAVEYAYGNAEHDVEAYQSVGIPNSRIFTIGDIAGVRNSTPIRDNYCTHLTSARAYPTATQP